MTPVSAVRGLAFVVFVGLPNAGLADPCQDRFTELYLQLDQGVPIKTFATTQFKGAPPMTNEFYYIDHGHYMSVPIEPAREWALTYNKVTYQSSDEGKTWSKLRETDSDKIAEDAVAAKKENAATIRNAACGEEELDGVMVDTVAADLTVKQGMVSENRYTYWVRRVDGFIVKATYDTKAPNFEMFVTQESEIVPDLELPKPK